MNTLAGESVPAAVINIGNILGSVSAANSTANVNVLFGSILGISAGAAALAAWLAAGLVVLLLVLARPLLFASVDPVVARARGVPVRLLGSVFLAIVGATAAEASQAIGALLLFGLMAAPPAAAQRLTNRPWAGFALAGALSVLCLWVGICVSYAAPSLPASFTIMTASTLLYGGAASWRALRARQVAG